MRGLVLVVAALLAGCRSGSDERVPAPAASIELEPLAAAPGRFLDGRGWISVPIPTGDGWECLEDQHGEHEAAAVAIRCRRADPREFLFFAAKTHRQPRDQRADAETVLMSLYRADNEAFFERVEYLSSHGATLAGAAAWESELLAVHARLGEIHKRERLAIVGDRIVAISAEGSPSLWDQHREQIERWFSEVEFAH